MVTIECHQRNYKAGCDMYNKNRWIQKPTGSGLSLEERIRISLRGMNMYSILIKTIKV